MAVTTSTHRDPTDTGTTPPSRPWPVVIQGGMGVGVSSWQLAATVARAGQLGVVSGTALDAVLARRLQDGDPGGHARRALAAFAYPQVSRRILERYHRPQGREGRPYLPVPRLAVHLRHAELIVAGTFVEVWLAKQGHDGPIGVNFLEKIQMATPAAAYGAMLAGADYVLMGAGIPRQIPRLLDDLAAGRPGSVDVDVAGGEPVPQVFDPVAFADRFRDPADGEPAPLPPVPLPPVPLPPVHRPRFLAIVSSHVLAQYLDREDSTRPEGFVVEGPQAGGHNAPPRGRLQLDETGQPVYGPRDEARLDAIARIGLPFWLAGGYGEPERVREALAAGAAGVQVGTLFALCRESGLDAGLREQVLRRLDAGDLEVRTDAAASPTGFPFKVAQLPGTLSDPLVRQARERLCDLGYLRQPYQRAAGAVGYRCPAEPQAVLARKNPDEPVDDAHGATCLCNALMADIGLGQTRKDGYVEPPLLTLGSDLTGARRLDQEHWLRGGAGDGWSAEQALAWLLSQT